ncbi:cysteine--tRNA ligase [Limosilactobacillus equigenerosi]|uniref:Cysteine--tRNA ligase n=1 Tax=Limosilactobacillus equigenerosi DSM 18793 = JCM 14505 TaxID=1423742 RepID=A0A0R1UM84_9LACO|nr:cysteine--tRNA ligase [Limosilactobacillus equigenerosi]KRL92618.1 Cysteinyl-tRNA synthetase [Limosilactobacillus equigenerosi DSM 18793 = JCM 14505]
MLQLYNTLTRQKEVFTPITPGVVKMYVCGPTVYNYIHIGNGRSAVAFDTIRRYLEFSGYRVEYVSNFTDVDDKMIKAANAEGITVGELAERYIKAFNEDTAALNVLPATSHPRATEYIDQIIAFVSQLIDNGYAYESAGDVYYRARKFAKYGQLSGQSIDNLEVGASEHITDEEVDKKEDPLDFALWKAAKPDEISWDSPWGAGRPGWHIECSVMSTDQLGPTFDIHAGGQDLQFPHHENEIAQSEAATGQKFVNYWLHNGFVTVGDDNEKMSKSLGNFVTVHDLIQQEDPAVIRFFMASTHYRRPVQFTEANLVEARRQVERLQTTYRNLSYRMQDATSGPDGDVQAYLATARANFTAAMDDDFNVANALAVIYDLVKYANQYIEQAGVQREPIVAMQVMLKKLVAIFGVELTDQAPVTDEDAQIKALIAERDAARANKDFARSDAIRDQLKAQGIILEDTPQGTRYRKES